ncbi:hypothetical protein BGZ76_006154, partial [Entomortierella beljakovae]
MAKEGCLGCLEAVIMNNMISSSGVLSNNPEIAIPDKWHTFKEGIFYAEGVEESPELTQLQALHITAKLGVSPISLMLGGSETSVTIDSSIYDTLPDKPFLILAHKAEPEKTDNLVSNQRFSTVES